MKWFAGSAACALVAGGTPSAVAQVSPSPSNAPQPAQTPAPQSVKGVVVTAVRPREQILLDRRVYSIVGDLQSITGTAADILNQIPSVDVDANGNISLRGDPNVTILVDGKPSAQFSGGHSGSALQQFPAQNIDRVEVMTNPPAQYKAEGTAGVINIITRKTHKAGLSGTANLSLGDKRRFVTSLNGSYNVGKLKLSAAVTVRQDDREREVTDDRTAVDPITSALVKSRATINEHFIGLTPSVKLGADYDVNDRQSVSLSFDRQEQSAKRFFLEQDKSGPTAGPPDAVSNRHSDGHEYDVFENEGLRFDQKLSRQDELLSFSFRRGIYDARDRYAYISEYLLPVAPESRDGLRVNEHYQVLEASADYTLPMHGGRSLKLGYDIEDDTALLENIGYTIDPATGEAINNPAITNQFHFHQQFNAAYAQYETPLGAWTLETGVRLEQTNVDDLLKIGDVATRQSYFRAYPSVNLGRKIGDEGKLTLSVSRRVTPPSADDLNPFVDTQDIYNLRAGNADLLPQDTWSYEVGNTGKFKALDYSLTAYYRFDRDKTVPVTRPVSGNVTLTTVENLPKSKSAGLEFSVNGKLGSRLSYALSGNLFYNQIDPGALAVGGLRDTVGLNNKASVDWRPASADTAQISFSRTDNRLTPQGYISAINLVNVGFRHQLWGGLSAVMTVTDLFDGQRIQRIAITPALQDNFNRHYFGRVGFLGLTYTFGGSKKSKPDTFDYDPSS